MSDDGIWREVCCPNCGECFEADRLADQVEKLRAVLQEIAPHTMGLMRLKIARALEDTGPEN